MIAVICGSNFSLKVQLFRVCRIKNRIFFSAGPFFFLLYMLFYWCALIPRKLRCRKKNPGYAPAIMVQLMPWTTRACILQKIFRSSHWMCSKKKGVLKNFANFTGKHLFWRSLLLIKLQAFSGKEAPTQVLFLWNVWNFKNTYFEEHLQTVYFISLARSAWKIYSNYKNTKHKKKNVKTHCFFRFFCIKIDDWSKNSCLR